MNGFSSQVHCVPFPRCNALSHINRPERIPSKIIYAQESFFTPWSPVRWMSWKYQDQWVLGRQIGKRRMLCTLQLHVESNRVRDSEFAIIATSFLNTARLITIQAENPRWEGIVCDFFFLVSWKKKRGVAPTKALYWYLKVNKRYWWDYFTGIDWLDCTIVMGVAGCWTKERSTRIHVGLR